MRKATCFILSLLIFATPLFAIKEAIYNAQGVKVGYIEKVNGKTIYYDKNGFTTDRIDMGELIQKEYERRREIDKAFGNTSVDPALDAFNEAYERGKKNKNSSETYKVCPISYCKHQNLATSKFCSECAHSLAGTNISSSNSSYTSSSDTPSAHSQPYFKRCVNSNCKQANYDYAKSCYKCGTSLATAVSQKNDVQWGIILIPVAVIAVIVQLGYWLFPPE